MQTGHSSLDPQDRAEYNAAVNAQIDALTLAALPRVALVSGIVHLMGIPYLMLAPEPINLLPVLLAISALLSFALFGALRTWALARSHAPAVTAALIALAWLNILYPLLTTGDLRATTLLMLVNVSTGLLLVRAFWFGLLLSLSFAGQLATRLIFSAEALGETANTIAEWRHAGFGLALASMLAAGVYAVRRANCTHIARMRLHSEAQAAANRRRAAQVETSRTIAEHFSAIDDMDTLLHRATDSIGSHYGCTFVGIFMMDAKTGELVARAGTGSAGQAAIQSGTRISVGRGIIGWVAENRRVAYARDTARDPRFVIWNLRPDTRSELTLPLHIGEHMLGVLDIQSDRPNAFHDEDMTALHLMANHIALAIQNMLLRQMTQEHRRLTEALHHVSQALSRPLDTQAAFDMILQQLTNVIPYDRGSIMLQNEALLEMVAARGFPSSRLAFRWRIPVRAGDVYDEIRRTQRPLVLEDALRRANWFHLKDLLPARSWMGIPLIHDDEVIGMLSLARETYMPFTEDEMNFAAMFAWQASIALENARLNSELARAVARTQSI